MARPTVSSTCLAAALCIGGCGAADGTPTAPDDDDGPTSVAFTHDANTCPLFEGSLVLPRAILAGENALVAVRAVDPDADDLTLKYHWSAATGEFTEPTLPITEYRCSERGPQLLTVVASDQRDCDVQLQLDVLCVAD